METKIEFSTKLVLKNGNRINKSNWHKITAKDPEPNKSWFGNSEIDRQRRDNGAYHDTWKLKKENEGYIFREINSNTGINGHHKTVRKAVLAAVRLDIKVFLEDGEVGNA